MTWITKDERNEELGYTSAYESKKEWMKKVSIHERALKLQFAQIQYYFKFYSTTKQVAREGMFKVYEE